MTQTVYPCPECGREVNRHGEPFDSELKTRKHLQAIPDHDGSAEIEAVERDEDEIENEQERVGQANNLIETVRGEESVAQAAERNAEEVNVNAVELEEHDLTLARLQAENDDLRERVERLEAVVAELSEVIEFTSIAASGSNSADNLRSAKAVYQNEGDAGLRFETDVHGIRDDALERGQYP